MTAAQSASALVFVQRCQVAAGAIVLEDDTEELSRVWECLDHFPRDPASCRVLSDRTVAATAIYRLALAVLDQRRNARAASFAVAPRRRTVNELMRLLRDDYRSPAMTLQWCSRRLTVSVSCLSRAIASESGYHFPAHVNGIRLLAAIRRLGMAGCRIKSIAHDVGYRDTGELDRQFQRRFGLSPRQYQDLILRLVPDETPLPLTPLVESPLP